MDCPCAPLDDAQSALEVYRLQAADKDAQIDYLTEQVSRLKTQCGQSDLLNVHDIALMMGTTKWAVYQRVARDAAFPKRVALGRWDRGELECYFTERGEDVASPLPASSDAR